MPEIIGWGSALVLLPAFGMETYRQWSNRHEPGNSTAIWLFVLLLIGTGGQVIYSGMVHNWVFLALNSILVINNGFGLALAIRRPRPLGPSGARHSLREGRVEGRASAPSPATSSEARGSGLRGQTTMNPGDQSDGHRPESSANNPVVHATTEPGIATGRGAKAGQELRPEETVIAETSPGARALSSAPLSTGGPAQPRRADAGTTSRDRDNPGRIRPSEHPNATARPGQLGWKDYAIMGVVALACGMGGAWTFSRFDPSKDDGSGRAKEGDPGSSKGGDSSKSQAKGQGGGSKNDQANGDAPSGDFDGMKGQLQHLNARLEAIQRRVDSMSLPRDTNPPDFAALRVKVGELSRSVEDANRMNSRAIQMENRLDRLQEELKDLKAQGEASPRKG